MSGAKHLVPESTSFRPLRAARISESRIVFIKSIKTIAIIRYKRQIPIVVTLTFRLKIKRRLTTKSEKNTFLKNNL